ncbi:TetR/AcrR family transcriptional regulator [Kitasatospora sp. NPDC018619]|uniref:TetR/AcrR family transcriptional regulator n=1 Tax=unclassified Kitasatospora TaxID=2633591 RepID=UPI0037B1CB15
MPRGAALLSRPAVGPWRSPSGRSFVTDARRAQIIAAAIETVAELGYARASFAQIAKRARISSVRLISYHFDDKEDLFQSVVDTVQDEARAFMQPRIRAHTEPAAMLAASIEPWGSRTLSLSAPPGGPASAHSNGPGRHP